MSADFPPSKHPGGRPSKATPALVAKLAAAIATGLTDEEAGALCGVSPDTVTRWRKDTDSKFCGSVKAATAQRLQKRLGIIESGRPGWQGVAWILERTMGNRFAAPRVALEHAGPGGRPLLQVVKVVRLPAKEQAPA